MTLSYNQINMVSRFRSKTFHIYLDIRQFPLQCCSRKLDLCYKEDLDFCDSFKKVKLHYTRFRYN